MIRSCRSGPRARRTRQKPQCALRDATAWWPLRFHFEVAGNGKILGRGTHRSVRCRTKPGCNEVTKQTYPKDAEGAEKASLFSASLPFPIASLRLHSSAKRLLQGMLEARCEQLCRAVRLNGHQIFAADAEFPRNINARFVGESHVGLQARVAALHQIRILVHVQSDPMPQAVREIFVAGAESGGGDNGARGIVDRAGKAAGAGGD